MKIAAHRGFSALYPENTMLAFKRAAGAGADEIELDVQLSADGIPVIIHDETVDRVAGKPPAGKSGWVKDLTLKELQALNVTAGFDERFGQNPIPTLEEYLAWVKGEKLSTNIELKNSLYFYPELEEKTIALVRKYNQEDRVILSSFNHLSLTICKTIAPDIKRGALVEKSQALINPGFYCRAFGFDFYHPEWSILSAESAANCLAWEVGINVWTVNDYSALPKLEALGCRAVITNNPQDCREALKAQPASS